MFIPAASVDSCPRSVMACQISAFKHIYFIIFMCNIKETGKHVWAKSINYEHIHPSWFCSLELFMSTKLIGDQPASHTLGL